MTDGRQRNVDAEWREQFARTIAGGDDDKRRFNAIGFGHDALYRLAVIPDLPDCLADTKLDALPPRCVGVTGGRTVRVGVAGLRLPGSRADAVNRQARFERAQVGR